MYKITRVDLIRNVKLRSLPARPDGTFLVLRASDGLDMTFGPDGRVVVTHADWPVTFHIGPGLIATIESEHVAPPPDEVTKVERRPTKSGKKEAA